MMLFILSISILGCLFAYWLLCILITICWKLLKFMILLPFRVLFPTPITVRDYYAEDESAIWLKGEKGRYFRYDLNTPFDDKQMDDFNEFYGDYLAEKELQKMKEKVNV